jgi:hypothetical protein
MMMKNFEENGIFHESINVDKVILDTIKDVLRSVLGRKSYSSIYRSMRHHSMKWSDVPNNAEVFSVLLANILGRAHVIIEDLIVESIYEKMGVTYTVRKDYVFHNYIDDLVNS